MNINSVRCLSDEELLRHIEAAAQQERRATAQLIALLAEMDARRLYLQQGYSSLFVYCIQSLHLSEHAAYGRIEAARAARKFPLVLEQLTEGSITLTTLCLLSNHLTADNHQQLLAAARHKSRREVEEQVAALRPMNAIPSAVSQAAAVDTGHVECEERGFLQFHHVIPFADGGETSTENLQLRCRPHNAYEAQEHFGIPGNDQ